jgi:hypothetical protein
LNFQKERKMSRKHLTRTIVLMPVLAAFMAAAAAQQQNQNQNANQPGQQSPPVQTQQKKSIWQKMKDMSQAGQNAVQQGSNTVQQGKGTIQQTGQQVQGTIQQIPNQGSMQQAPNGAQQGIDGTQGAANGFQTNGAGGGAGTCGPSCFDAGPFQANVSQMTMSQEGGWHIIRMNIQFHNSTNQPLVIAYHDGSMVMVDNNGNTYIPAGGNPGQLQGMGIDRGNQTDSQFQLGPGQTGYALFSVARGRAANSPIGTSYSYNLTIDELQLQNGALAIPVRTYNLNFPSLAPGTSNASFGSASSPATAVVTNGNRLNSVGAAIPQANGQNVPGQRQAGVGVGTGIGVATPQRVVNGKPSTAATLQSTPASAVNSAAMKTAMPTTMKTPVNTPARAQAAPVVANKPNPATPAVKPAPVAQQKKVAATATTTTK